jgi:N-formylmaleamate deformylase
MRHQDRRDVRAVERSGERLAMRFESRPRVDHDHVAVANEVRAGAAVRELRRVLSDHPPDQRTDLLGMSVDDIVERQEHRSDHATCLPPRAPRRRAESQRWATGVGTLAVMRSTLVDTAAGQQHIWTAGDGAPLVFLHGFTDDGACWSPIAGELGSDRWRIVAPDCRGHGRTRLPPDEPFTAERRVADVVALIDALRLGPSVLVGHSMGALTAMLVAADHPGRVRGVVLEDPPLAGARFEPTADAANPFREWATEMHEMAEGDLIAHCSRENPTWSDAERWGWASSKRALDLTLFDRSQTWLGASWRDIVGRVAAPLLVITGEVEFGAAMSTDACRWLLADGRSLLALPRAGHSVRRDQPTAYLAALTGFLAGVDTRR